MGARGGLVEGLRRRLNRHRGREEAAACDRRQAGLREVAAERRVVEDRPLRRTGQEENQVR